ncbi:sulfotransferase domain-containing protein [Labrenzia sp. VG12]|uniref:sulfotransferase domain-containing protein n=1 Tax=Labrenzia sp. VG12 TaxID=2021862 RepID=UPI001FFD210D|nr:sulfotransferase domain-containing protein [Labrenzia sp. VG12]
MRDPRDTIVSLYHQLSSRTTRPVGLTLSEFIRSPEYGWDRMMRFYAIWDANLRTPRSMLLMSYEGLLRSPATGIEHVANFLGVKLSQEQVSKIADVSSAETMRQGERQGKIAQMRVLGSGLNALKVRKAKSGTYKEEMSEEDQLWCEKKMSDFPVVFSDLVKEKGADFIQLENSIA